MRKRSSIYQGACVRELGCVFTFTGDCVCCQLITLFTLAEERTNKINAEVLTGTLHITFVHIWGKTQTNKHMSDMFGSVTDRHWQSVGFQDNNMLY